MPKVSSAPKRPSASAPQKDHPKLLRIFPSFSQNDSLRCGSQHRIPKPLFFFGIWEYTAVFGFQLGNNFFPKALATKIRVSAPASYKNLPSKKLIKSWTWVVSGRFARGVTERGVFAFVANTLSLSAAGLATVLSHKCDIPSMLKDDQIARDNRLPVHCRRLRLLRHHSVPNSRTRP